MPSRVEPVAIGQSADPHVNGILEAMRDGWWGDTGFAGVIGRRPETLKSLATLVEKVYTESGIEPPLLELLRIKTALVRDDPYSAQVRVGPFADMVEPKVPAISEPRPQPSAVLTEREAVAVQLAERMALNPHTVDDALFARVTQHFSTEQVSALVFASCLFNLLSCNNIALHVDTDAGSPYQKGLVYRQEVLVS